MSRLIRMCTVWKKSVLVCRAKKETIDNNDATVYKNYIWSIQICMNMLSDVVFVCIQIAHARVLFAVVHTYL